MTHGPLSDAEQVARVRLCRTPRVGPVGFRRLLRRFGTAEAALVALPEVARAAGASPPVVPGRGAAERELEALARLGGRVLFLDGPEYPPLLGETPDAPPLLLVLGNPAVLRARAVALVGGRNSSVNGQRMAEALATDLAAAGLVVVSGLARGIDAAAHRGAMFVGTTVACVAGGLDRPYPPEHAELQAEIAVKGCVVTEAPPGTQPTSRHFPRRNRIIAGLSLGVVVVEAARHSGSLITARIAEELARPLFAVPGSPLDPRSRGGNDLLREGAVLTEAARDVLAGLPEAEDGAEGWDGRAAPAPGEAPDDVPALPEPSGPSPAARLPAPAAGASGRRGGSGREAEDGSRQGAGAPPEADPEAAAAREAVVALLDASPTPVDEVVRRCHLSPSVVVSALLELELAGRIETLPGNRVCLLGV